MITAFIITRVVIYIKAYRAKKQQQALQPALVVA